MYVNPEVFHAYDVRGLFPEDLNAQGTYIIARAFVEYLRAHTKDQLTIIVGTDARPSSPELKKGLIEGLLDEGVKVIDQGYTTTPYHYYTVYQQHADGGLMITASHNPYRYNGVKFTMPPSRERDDFMDVIKEIARRGIFKNNEQKGEVVPFPESRKYVDDIVSRFDLQKAKNMKIVLNGGGGMITLFLKKLQDVLPCKVILMNEELLFDLKHEPLNPIKEESLASLKNKVLEERADFGVAFDSDADRSGFVTNNARYFRGDYVGAFFAREFLKQNPGAKIIHDLRASSIARETIKAGGGEALELRVGNRYIKEAMHKQDAIFASEVSGHFYFKDVHGMDSDLLPLLYFLKFVSESGKTADEILDEFAVYPSSGEINFEVKDKEKVLDKIAAYYKDARETKWLDGFTVYYDDWWANIRLSNTEPLVRLNLEARTKEILHEKLTEIRSLIQS